MCLLGEQNVGPQALDRIENKVFRDETVRLDGRLFLNCSFEDCLLCDGGEPCEWENTRFSNCRFVLDGLANNTVQVLQGFGFRIVPPELGDIAVQ
jgi:hypothetical protein